MMEMVKYRLQSYFKSNRFVVPFAAVMVFLYIMYSVKPVGIVDSFSVSSIAVFLLMSWVGMSVSSAEEPVDEQLQLLNIQSNAAYYLSKVLFLAVLGVIAGAVCVVFPIAQNLLNSNHLFTRQLTFFDIGNAILLLSSHAFVGGAVGSMFHPRAVRDRTLATIMTMLVSLLSVVRIGLVGRIPILKAVTWILPPVDQVAVLYAGTDMFLLPQTLLIFISLLFYGGVFSLIMSYVCYRRKF